MAKAKLITAKICIACGAEFMPPTFKGAWRAKYCSHQCCNRTNKRLADERMGQRHRVCEACGKGFSYFIARGTDRRFCTDAECRANRMRTLAGGKPLCVTIGCKNKRGYKSGICNSCYYRLKRTGTLERRVYAYRSLGTNGYIFIYDPGHPLATRQGRLFEHRKVLFDAIGPGTHPCYWCKTPVTWLKNARAKDGTLVADHLDGNKTNNSIENLVPACSRCNWRRGLLMCWVRDHKDDPFLWQLYVQARDKTA